jgi:glycosyltransferase involved in cell wall biosynthesis
VLAPVTADRPLRIVCISPFVPHPGINHAGGKLLYDYLRRLAQSADVTLIAPGSPQNHWAVAYSPPRLKVKLFAVDPRWNLHMRALLQHPRDSIFGLTDGIVVLGGFEADREVTALVGDADIVEVQFAQFLPLLDAVRRIDGESNLTAWEHDVFSDHIDDVLRDRPSVRRRLQSYGRRRWIPHEERRLLNLCSAVVALSNKDAELIRRLGVRAPIEVVWPHVDVPPEPAPLDGPSRVIFAGAMWRRENQRAAEWLVGSIWPRVRAAVPDARLVLAGDAPAVWVRRMCSLPGVEATGYVHSFDQFYRTSSVAVVPVRGGAGIKVKTLQAMACGLPVVSTYAGATAIASVSGHRSFAALTDDGYEFASAIVRCLSDRDHGRRVGASGRRWVSKHCNFEDDVAKLLRRYETLARPPSVAARALMS